MLIVFMTFTFQILIPKNKGIWISTQIITIKLIFSGLLGPLRLVKDINWNNLDELGKSWEIENEEKNKE